MNKLEKVENVILFMTVQTIAKFSIHTPEELKDIKREDYYYTDYLVEACDKRNIKLYVLTKSNIHYFYKDNTLNIYDSYLDVKFSLSDENVKNTIIFQGQSNKAERVAYDGLITMFENLGYFVINGLQAIKTASDKFLSASVMSRYNIPQPNYILVTLNDIVDTNGMLKPSFYDYIHSLYDNYENINNETTDYKYVCKTLDGSLGLGVFICDEHEILSVLQTIFAVDEDINIIIQQFKNNTGDIRTHVFSYDLEHYEILAAMKRNKIKGDFRSNVSLGASTSAIELTKEQEQIVINTAKASGCHWVGVDLMDCLNEIGEHENVVIEYNSSPGINGISSQINKNMFDVVLDKIDEHLHSKKITETVEVGNNVVTDAGNYAFNNVLLFTGPKDDAQILLKEICDTSNINLYKFNPENMKYDIKDKSISITENNTKLDIDYDKVSPSNTIVFSRVMPENAEALSDLYSRLIEDKFLFFNKSKGVEIAGDKYKTAELFKKHRINQAKYVLVDANDVVKENVKLFDKLKTIYKDAETNRKHKYVVKNPTGGQGIGVFMADGENILSILQAYFDVAPDKKLLVQEFMEADGGDFRVHVLNLKSGQYILAAMKRDTIDGDFRSNVSLGAKTEEVKLTDEQKQLAIRAADVLDLRWVGVDIMPVKNSDVKNVVIECNSGAGVAGISTLINKNIFNLMFEKIKKEDLG